MIIKSIDKRLTLLEEKHSFSYSDILEMIEQHRMYDELSSAEKEHYCEYVGIDLQTYEEVNSAVLGSLHFELMPREKTPTKEELKSIISEMENYVLSIE